MGIIEFFIFCVVVVVAGGLCVLAMKYFSPDHPRFIDNIVWGVVVLVILYTLVQATGLLSHDPQIPRLR